MRRKSQRRLLALLGASLALAAPAAADVPELMSHQGVLTLPDGSSPEDGPYSLTFRIFDNLEGLHYEETLGVELRGGLYGVLLGGSGSTTLSSAFADHPRFLEIEIVSGAEPGVVNAVLEPRQRISPVPFALVTTVATATIDPPDPVPSGMIILWDQPTGCGAAPDQCPCGWDEATEFRGVSVRGADTAERWADLSDDVGTTQGAAGGTGMYGDSLTAAEAPEHAHTSADAGTHNHPLTVDDQGAGPYVIGIDFNGPYSNRVHEASAADGDHSHTTTASGGGGPHLHAARRVLFCRKL